MHALVVAARDNDVDNLHRLIDLEMVKHVTELDSANTSTKAMQDACHEAARYNHTAALEVLLDAGCWIDPGDYSSPTTRFAKGLPNSTSSYRNYRSRRR